MHVEWFKCPNVHPGTISQGNSRAVKFLASLFSGTVRKINMSSITNSDIYRRKNAVIGKTLSHNISLPWVQVLPSLSSPKVPHSGVPSALHNPKVNPLFRLSHQEFLAGRLTFQSHRRSAKSIPSNSTRNSPYKDDCLTILLGTKNQVETCAISAIASNFRSHFYF